MKQVVHLPSCCFLMCLLALAPYKAFASSMHTLTYKPSNFIEDWLPTPESLPECETYEKIHALLSEYSSKVEFLPAATEYYFDASAAYYDYLALPIAAVPADRARVEVFGQLYDPHYYALSNLDESHWLHNFKPLGEMDWGNAKLAIGLGTSFKLTSRIKVRSFYTTGTIPGLGDSKLALSAQISF